MAAARRGETSGTASRVAGFMHAFVNRARRQRGEVKLQARRLEWQEEAGMVFGEFISFRGSASVLKLPIMKVMGEL